MVLTRGIGAAGLVLAALLSWPPPGDARAAALRVVRERAYRLGDGLLSLEHTLLRPPALEPGQRASLRVATPYSERARIVRYRFTWRHDDGQHQSRPEDEPPAWLKAGPGP